MGGHAPSGPGRRGDAGDRHPQRRRGRLAGRAPEPSPPTNFSADAVGTHPTPKADARVGAYSASFYTAALHHPVPRPGTTWTGPESVTFLCVPAAPVGFCLSAPNYPGDDPESRRAPFLALAGQLRYAARPADPNTWFDARDALPV